MRTTGSTMSRFDKQRAVKSLGMPHSRRDNAVRGNPAVHQNINTRHLAGVYIICRIFYSSISTLSMYVRPTVSRFIG